MTSFLKRYKMFLFLALVAILGLGSVAQRVVAQDPALSETTASGQISIASGTPAILISASTTGQKIQVKRMKIATVTAGGTVTFYNGADATKQIFTAYAPVSTTVNNNVDIGRDVLPQQGSGMLQTSANTAFCAQLNGSTLVYEITYQLY